MKKMNKKGFTLAELLIVVAIIAVLVAIAIPVFTAQLEKAREATDAANIRSAYAELMTDALSQSTPATITKEVKLKQQVSDWQNTFEFPANLKAGSTAPSSGATATLSYTVDATTGNGTASIDIKLAK